MAVPRVNGSLPQNEGEGCDDNGEINANYSEVFGGTANTSNSVSLRSRNEIGNITQINQTYNQYHPYFPTGLMGVMSFRQLYSVQPYIFTSPFMEFQSRGDREISQVPNQRVAPRPLIRFNSSFQTPLVTVGVSFSVDRVSTADLCDTKLSGMKCVCSIGVMACIILLFSVYH